MIRLCGVLVVVGLLPETLAGQSLEQRIGARADGTVRLSFAARPGICGDGVDGISMRNSNDEWQPDCEGRVVRVALRLSNRQVHSMRAYVGGRWIADPTVLDLGPVSTKEVAPYFIGLAERTGGRLVAGDPLLPAVLADSVTVWPSLVRVARNQRISAEVRGRAVFWLSQAAGTAAGQALDSIASDEGGNRDVRKHVVFALSQRSRREGVPALIRIARSNADPEIRRTALFWLGQSEDPRAIDLFEEILQ